MLIEWEMTSIIFDARALRLYPVGKPGFSGGTESYLRTITHGLAARGNLVHVVTPDLEHEQQRGATEFWWGPDVYPTRADYVVAVHNLEHIAGYVGQHFILMPNGVDPWLGNDGMLGNRLSAVACFSQCHIDLLTEMRPTISPNICHITGLGVSTAEYQGIRDVVSGRILFANDPARGLHHVLAIFDAIRKKIPEAELRIAYDFERQFEPWTWQATVMAEQLWGCKERIAQGNGVVDLGGISREELVAEQLSAHLHIMPSDPPNLGSQIHGMTQMEMAAAGVPMLLSDIEAFPEVFGGVATILPVPGTLARARRNGHDLARIGPEDWAERAVRLMRNERAWQKASRMGRELAAKHDWSMVLDRWETMLGGLRLDS